MPESASDLAAELHVLAEDVARLSPDYQLPERFFERRSELVHRLRQLARAERRRRR